MGVQPEVPGMREDLEKSDGERAGSSGVRGTAKTGTATTGTTKSGNYSQTLYSQSWLQVQSKLVQPKVQSSCACSLRNKCASASALPADVLEGLHRVVDALGDELLPAHAYAVPRHRAPGGKGQAAVRVDRLSIYLGFPLVQ